MVLVVLKPTAGAAEELENLQGKQGVSGLLFYVPHVAKGPAKQGVTNATVISTCSINGFLNMSGIFP